MFAPLPTPCAVIQEICNFSYTNANSLATKQYKLTFGVPGIGDGLLVVLVLTIEIGMIYMLLDGVFGTWHGVFGSGDCVLSIL